MTLIHRRYGDMGSVEVRGGIVRDCATQLDNTFAEQQLMQRISAYIRRQWPENTAKHLASVCGRERKFSLSMARAVIECRRTMPLIHAVTLSKHPGFGIRFMRVVFGLPEEPDNTKLLESLEKLREKIERI